MRNICGTSLRDDKLQENPRWSEDVLFQENSRDMSRVDGGSPSLTNLDVDIETGYIAGTEPLSWEEIAKLEVNRGVGGGAEILLSNTVPDVPQGHFRQVHPMVKAGPIDVLQPLRNMNTVIKGQTHRSLHERFLGTVLTCGLKTTIFWSAFSYLFEIILFATFYYAGEPYCTNEQHDAQHFRIAVYLSMQTTSTVGYGSIYPISIYCNSVMIVQSFVSLVLIAILTSVLYIQFSRPRPKILFSDNAVLYYSSTSSSAVEHGHWCFSFQISKFSAGAVCNAEVKAVMWDYTNFPEVKRVTLGLYQPFVPWMEHGIRCKHIVSTANASPMINWSLDRSRRTCMPTSFHILVTFDAVHAVTGNPVNKMFSYTSENILFQHRFSPDFHGRYDLQSGILQVNLDKLNEVLPVGDIALQVDPVTYAATR